MSSTAWDTVDPAEVRRGVAVALDEDLRLGPDVTTEATVSADAVGTARVVAREPGVIAGIPVASTCAPAISRATRPSRRRTELMFQVARVKGMAVSCCGWQSLGPDARDLKPAKKWPGQTGPGMRSNREVMI